MAPTGHARTPNARARNVFLTVEDLAHRGSPVTERGVAGAVADYFGYVEPDPAAQIALLRRLGYVKRRPLWPTPASAAPPVTLRPTRRGARAVEGLEEAYYLTRGLIHGVKSEAFRALCRTRQGLDLCQHGTLTAAQQSALAEVVAQARPHRIIDLGCGAGELGTSLAESCHAGLLGIDRSCTATDYARRQAAGRGRHGDGTAERSFRCDDLEAFVQGQKLSTGAESCIIVVDAVYWLQDPVAFFERCLELLAPGGVLAVLWSEFAERPPGARTLPWEETGLGSALLAAGGDRGDVRVIARDFTEEERAVWVHTPAICAGLEHRFTAEGRLFLLRTLLRAAEHLEEVMRRGPGARYLLVVSRAQSAGPPPGDVPTAPISR